MYSSANTDEIETHLICTYNEKCRSEEAYENLMTLVWIRWWISIRVKVTVQGHYHLWGFRSYDILTYQITFDLDDYPMKNYMHCYGYLVVTTNFA